MTSTSVLDSDYDADSSLDDADENEDSEIDSEIISKLITNNKQKKHALKQRKRKHTKSALQPTFKHHTRAYPPHPPRRHRPQHHYMPAMPAYIAPFAIQAIQPYGGYNPSTPTQHQKIEELQQTLTQQIEYFEQEKQKRKQRKLLRKQRRLAAIKIQRWWRKARVIEKWKDPLLNEDVRQLLLNNELANKYLDDLILEYFRGEFVPDLLIEIFSNEGDADFHQKDIIAQITWSFYEEMELPVCQRLCEQICNESIDEIVRAYFFRNENKLELRSILLFIQKEMISEVLAQETKRVVEESIEELIMEYFIENKATRLFNEYLFDDIVYEIVDETLNEYILQTDVVDAFLVNECVLKEWLTQIASEQYQVCKQQIMQQKKEKESDLMEACLVRYLLNEELLKMLLEKLSTRSQRSFVRQKSINLLLDKEMSSVLIEKHVGLYRTHAATKQNSVLNEMLMKLLCDTGIELFIDFLKNNDSHK
eukprot:CAMPEP_0197076420 /NCGR_PEP_ID=MMETSP1384-20130603/212106_1 /TAXON_ID=29189 /ORGANISM="Ammonia sp." /LENGTH=478 /DNA_ID=CAMNT_0042515277 /DNA_START=3 /DNA_END=1439 /DNA_ORIENTATION=+